MGITSACGRAEAPDERAVVIEVTQQACDAVRAGDVAAVERILAPTFTLVNSNSTVQDRRSVVAEVQNRDPQYQIFRNHSMTSNVYGDAAVVQGITHVKGTSGGQQFEAEVRFSDTLIKTDGQWRLVVSHVTGMQAPQGTT
ncbi:MAG TPA: nuclear transport factor 2 family protein [Rubricoccaceae bacterium]|jgi:ketosteroid isomerase-like protein